MVIEKRGRRRDGQNDAAEDKERSRIYPYKSDTMKEINSLLHFIRMISLYTPNTSIIKETN